MPPKLSENEVLKLIQLYREHECLWNNKCEEYRNKEMRKTALQQIQEGMAIEGFNINEIKTKIKSTRSSYYLELDKIEKSTRSGAGGNVYKPRAKWFDELNAFIRNVSVRRATMDNADKENFNSKQNKENVNSEQGSSSANIMAPQTDESSLHSEMDSTSVETPAFTPPTPIRSKRSKLSQMAVMIKDLKNIQGDTMLRTDEETDFDFFGRSVALQLKKLSEEQAVIAQEKIQSTLTHCRLADIRAKQSNSAFSFQYPQFTQPMHTQYPQTDPTNFTSNGYNQLLCYPPPPPPPPSLPTLETHNQLSFAPSPPPLPTCPPPEISPSGNSGTTSSSSLGFHVNNPNSNFSPIPDSSSCEENSQNIDNIIEFAYNNA